MAAEVAFARCRSSASVSALFSAARAVVFISFNSFLKRSRSVSNSVVLVSKALASVSM